MNLGELVAVYGSLRHGLGNHRLLQGAVRQEDGKVAKDTFKMYSLGGFPGLVKDKGPEITVEIYELDTEQRIQSLDRLEGYPNFYDREVVTLLDGRKCWIYFLISGRDNRSYAEVTNGDWKSYYTRRF